MEGDEKPERSANPPQQYSSTKPSSPLQSPPLTSPQAHSLLPLSYLHALQLLPRPLLVLSRPLFLTLLLLQRPLYFFLPPLPLLNTQPPPASASLLTLSSTHLIPHSTHAQSSFSLTLHTRRISASSCCNRALCITSACPVEAVDWWVRARACCVDLCAWRVWRVIASVLRAVRWSTSRTCYFPPYAENGQGGRTNACHLVCFSQSSYRSSCRACSRIEAAVSST